jgi:hypothetical protein
LGENLHSRPAHILLSPFRIEKDQYGLKSVVFLLGDLVLGNSEATLLIEFSLLPPALKLTSIWMIARSSKISSEEGKHEFVGHRESAINLTGIARRIKP